MPDYERIELNRDTAFMVETTAPEVYECIGGDKNKNSLGGFFLKKEADGIAEKLAHIINLCLQSGTFPSTLKILPIKPIY